MAHATDHDTIEALKTLVGFVLKRVREVSARAETFRVLLEKHGFISHEEFLKTEAEALVEWDRALNAALLDAVRLANDEALNRLLEEHKGPPQ